jgi:hypothetical protein
VSYGRAVLPVLLSDFSKQFTLPACFGLRAKVLVRTQICFSLCSHLAVVRFSQLLRFQLFFSCAIFFLVPHQVRPHRCGTEAVAVRWYFLAPIARFSPAPAARVSPRSRAVLSYSLIPRSVFCLHRLSCSVWSVPRFPFLLSLLGF